MGIKLSSLDTTTLSEKGVAMPVRDPLFVSRMTEGDVFEKMPILYADDAKTDPITITVLGPDCTKVRRLLDPVRARLMTTVYAMQSRKGATVDVADIEKELRENIDIALAATLSWNGFDDEDGNPLPCTAENARQLYTRNPIICMMVVNFVRDRANFLPSSATS